MRPFRCACVLVVVLLLVWVPWLWGTERSEQWPEVRKAHVAEHPNCEACGASKKIEVHHVLPFHLYPELELDPKNLITLCQRCHLVFGHLGDYEAFNPLVREEAARHLEQVKARPYAKEDGARFPERFGRRNVGCRPRTVIYHNAP